MNQPKKKLVIEIMTKLLEENITFLFSHGVDGIGVFHFEAYAYGEAKKLFPDICKAKAGKGSKTVYV